MSPTPRTLAQPVRAPRRALTLAALVVAGSASGLACAARQPLPPEQSADETFADPRCAPVRGYTGDAMEPFVTRDGRYLLFNSSNAPGAQTDLQVARIDGDLAFTYRGPLTSANSTALDGVPTVAADGTLFFISSRSYATTGATVYTAHFANGTTDAPVLVAGMPREPGIVLFDVEVSADGQRLYYARGVFGNGSGPTAAELRVAVRRGNTFVPDT
ncbi:MAG TPA: hypothetical protein VGD56_13885, partial [Gemmatirosa sp.]